MQLKNFEIELYFLTVLERKVLQKFKKQELEISTNCHHDFFSHRKDNNF